MVNETVMSFERKEYLLALPSQLLFVNIINPNALDDLEDLITNVEFVVELCVGSC